MACRISSASSGVSASSASTRKTQSYARGSVSIAHCRFLGQPPGVVKLHHLGAEGARDFGRLVTALRIDDIHLAHLRAAIPDSAAGCGPRSAPAQSRSREATPAERRPVSAWVLLIPAWHGNRWEHLTWNGSWSKCRTAWGQPPSAVRRSAAPLIFSSAWRPVELRSTAQSRRLSHGRGLRPPKPSRRHRIQLTPPFQDIQRPDAGP